MWEIENSNISGALEVTQTIVYEYNVTKGEVTKIITDDSTPSSAVNNAYESFVISDEGGDYPHTRYEHGSADYTDSKNVALGDKIILSAEVVDGKIVYLLNGKPSNEETITETRIWEYISSLQQDL